MQRQFRSDVEASVVSLAEAPAGALSSFQGITCFQAGSCGGMLVPEHHFHGHAGEGKMPVAVISCPGGTDNDTKLDVGEMLAQLKLMKDIAVCVVYEKDAAEGEFWSLYLDKLREFAKGATYIIVLTKQDGSIGNVQCKEVLYAGDSRGQVVAERKRPDFHADGVHLLAMTFKQFFMWGRLGYCPKELGQPVPPALANELVPELPSLQALKATFGRLYAIAAFREGANAARSKLTDDCIQHMCRLMLTGTEDEESPSLEAACERAAALAVGDATSMSRLGADDLQNFYLVSGDATSSAMLGADDLQNFNDVGEEDEAAPTTRSPPVEPGKYKSHKIEVGLPTYMKNWFGGGVRALGYLDIKEDLSFEATLKLEAYAFGGLVTLQERVYKNPGNIVTRGGSMFLDKDCEYVQWWQESRNILSINVQILFNEELYVHDRRRFDLTCRLNFTDYAYMFDLCFDLTRVA